MEKQGVEEEEEEEEKGKGSESGRRGRWPPNVEHRNYP